MFLTPERGEGVREEEAMTDDTNTNTVDIETVLEAADIPEHASIHDVGWTDDNELEIEWTVDE